MIIPPPLPAVRLAFRSHAHRPEIMGHRVISRMYDFIVHGKDEGIVEVPVHHHTQSPMILQIDVSRAGVLRSMRFRCNIGRPEKSDAVLAQASRDVSPE